MQYTITCGYEVFERGTTEPVRKPNQQQLFGWLRNLGLSRKEATAIIKEVDSKGLADIELPDLR
jgi:hypothetical protein